MAEQNSWTAPTIDRSMAGVKKAGKRADLQKVQGGWGELLTYWHLLAAVFFLLILFGVNFIFMLVIFYVGIGFTAKGMLAKLIISVGKSFNTPGKNYSGLKAVTQLRNAPDRRAAQTIDPQALALQAVKNLVTRSNSQRLDRQISTLEAPSYPESSRYNASAYNASESLDLSPFSDEPPEPQMFQINSAKLLGNESAEQKDIIDRSSVQNSTANILTWCLYVALIGFSGLLIYAGYNPEFFKPVGWIHHPAQATYYGAMGLAIFLPLFIYFSFMGKR